MNLYCYHISVEFRILPLGEVELRGGLVGHHARDGEGGGGAGRGGVAAVQHAGSQAGLEDEVTNEISLHVHGLEILIYLIYPN